ncbi:protein rep [Mycolicibacter sinensis]|uniref:protein rep n=1 Tax=Mycolicibacter sinensis (strain JDM601) TaxID=875328 RepID=UPI0013F4DCE1|nr:protein rep [Mycolicibacter sinensis]
MRGSSREVLATVRTCKRKWHCLMCACAAAHNEADDLSRKIHRWSSLGGDIAFLTLTQVHNLDDPLDQLWLRLQSGWNKVTSGKQWNKIKASFGIRGYVRTTEIVHSLNRGWNVHYHVVLFADGGAWRGTRLDLMRVAMAERFQDGVREAGGTAMLTGQKIKPYIPGTHERLATYCFKGLMIWRSRVRPTRSPMAVLEDLEATGEGGDLWNEFAKAAVGRHQKSESRGLERVVPFEATPS